MAMIAASDDKAIRVRWSQHAVHYAFQDVLSGELLLKCSLFILQCLDKHAYPLLLLFGIVRVV